MGGGAAMQQEQAGSSDSGACSAFVMDAKGAFGTCTCGFKKAKHSAEAQIAAPSAPRQKRAATGLGRGKY